MVGYTVPGPGEAERLFEQISSSSGLAIERDPSAPRRFSVEAPRNARRSMYPIVAEVGDEDWFVYAPVLLPDCLGQATVEVTLGESSDQDVRCTTDAYLVVRGDGDGSRHVLFSEGDAVGEAIAAAATQALDKFTQRLGAAPAPSEVIGVSVTQDAPSGIVAHVDREGTILFEVKPSFRAGLNSDVLRTQVRPLLRHELFHRWNMAGGAASDDVPVWFYEGAAEYAGGLMSLEEGDFAPLEYNWVLGAMLNRCVAEIGERALSRNNRGRVYDYDCGGVASWLLDLDLRKQGADHYVFWRALVSRAERSGTGRYDWADVDAVLREGGWSAPTWRLFIGGSRADHLALALNAAGAEVYYEGAARDYRIALLHPLLAANCSSASYGFFDDPTGVTLDVDTVCAVLPSQAKISDVAGVNIAADAQGAHLAVRRACDSAETLTIVANGAPVVLHCATLQDPTPNFRLVSAGLREGVHDAL